MSRLYGHAVVGFAGTLPAPAVEALRRNPRVVSVGPDAAVPLFGTQTPPPSGGLDRVDRARLPLSGSYTWGVDGAGVNAYVVDTGVRGEHADLSGRVRAGYTAVADGRGTGDCNGHGTHVAGTVAGSAYGVAKRASSPSGCSTAPGPGRAPGSSPASTGRPSTTPPGRRWPT